MKNKFSKILYIFVLISFILPIIFILFKLISGAEAESQMGMHSSSDYTLMVVECVLGLFVIHIPSLLAKKFKFEIPVFLYVLYIIFLYCSITLGEVQSFYYLVPHWDVFLHAFSGVMTGFFGFMVISILNKDEHITINLSPVFMAVFAFSFAVAIGAVWEIYEFTIDSIMGLNMQKYILMDGTVLVGHDALIDTMKDIIVDVLGALIASITGYIAIRIKSDKKIK